MKSRQLTAAAALAFVAAAAQAQTAFCGAALKDINAGLRDIEIDKWREIGDDSAPRATLRQMKANNVMLQAQINLQLMRDAKCRMPAALYASSIYADIMDSCVKKSDAYKNGATGTAVLECALVVIQSPDLFK